MSPNSCPTGNAGRRGSALMVVMCISAALLLASMVMAYITNQAMARAQRLNTGAQALAIAEAGIADMVSLLSTNYNMWRDATNTADFGGGSFTVVSRTQTNGNVLITSSGTMGGVTRTTIMELLGTLQDINDSLFSLDGVILSGGDVRFSSAAFTINGNVHANGNVLSANGAQNGDFTNNAVITAVGSVGTLDATLQPNSPERVLPTFDFDSYRQMATNGGLYSGGWFCSATPTSAKAPSSTSLPEATSRFPIIPAPPLNWPAAGFTATSIRSKLLTRRACIP